MQYVRCLVIAPNTVFYFRTSSGAHQIYYIIVEAYLLLCTRQRIRLTVLQQDLPLTPLRPDGSQRTNYVKDLHWTRNVSPKNSTVSLQVEGKPGS